MGRELASLLMKDKHEVVVIEKEKSVSEEISREVDALVINGDGTQIKVLEEADVKNANFFIAATGRDEVNMLSCMLAKNMGVQSVVARVGNPEYRLVFKDLGMDHVISPEVTAAEYIERLIIRPYVVDLTTVGKSDMEILEYVVTGDSLISGKRVGEIHPKGFIFIAVYKDKELIVPGGDTVLEEGNTVLVAVKSESVKDVEKLFRKNE